jgi:hypothetical protein
MFRTTLLALAATATIGAAALTPTTASAHYYGGYNWYGAHNYGGYHHRHRHYGYSFYRGGHRHHHYYRYRW